MKKYFPILLSKAGELVAMRHIEQSVKDCICPIFEVLPNKLPSLKKTKKPPKIKLPFEDMLSFLLTHWSFYDNQVILDFSCFENLSSEIKEVKNLFDTLFKAGVNAIPAIQKNSPTNYITMVAKLIVTYNCKTCIRTSNQSGGFLTFNQDVKSLVTQLNTIPKNTVLLLDLGYAKKVDHTMLATIAGMSIHSLKPSKNNWLDIVVASSSFPENLTDFKVSHTPHRIERYEWNIWQILMSDSRLKGLKYGDFGTKYPFYSEAPFAGTISIKYTTQNEFLIYRGKMTDDHLLGHRQYIIHASNLIKINEYSGQNFSWGDLRIHEIGSLKIDDPKAKPGSPQVWVELSQNHHITLLNSLL